MHDADPPYTADMSDLIDMLASAGEWVGQQQQGMEAREILQWGWCEQCCDIVDTECGCCTECGKVIETE